MGMLLLIADQAQLIAFIRMSMLLPFRNIADQHALIAFLGMGMLEHAAACLIGHGDADEAQSPEHCRKEHDRNDGDHQREASTLCFVVPQ